MSDDALESSFFAIIPYRVLQSNLTPVQKIICGAIEGLGSKTGSCYAKNITIAKLLGFSEHSVDCSISRLYHLGAVKNIGKMKSRDLILNDDFFVGNSQNEKNENSGNSQNENGNSQNEKNDTIYKRKLKRNGQNGSNDPKSDLSFSGSKIYKKEAFKTFWKLYPLKVKKQESFTKFIKLKDDEIKDLLEAIPFVISYHAQEISKETPFIPAIPYPTTFINGKRWTDSVYLPKKILKGRADVGLNQGFDRDRFCEMFKFDDPGVYPEGAELITKAGMEWEDAVDFVDHNTVDDLLSKIIRVEVA